MSVVTESSTGPIKRFKEMIVAHVGVHGWVSPGSLLSGTLSSDGASTVARTSDRGRVVEGKPFFIEVCEALNPGFPFSPVL